MAKVPFIRDKSAGAGESGHHSKFHESYQDGKLYKVPDERLESMKELIYSNKTLTHGPTKDSFVFNDYERSKFRLDSVIARVEEIRNEINKEEKESSSEGKKSKENDEEKIIQEPESKLKEPTNYEKGKYKIIEHEQVHKAEREEYDDETDEETEEETEYEGEMKEDTDKNLATVIENKDVVEEGDKKENINENLEGNGATSEEDFKGEENEEEDEEEKDYKGQETIVRPPYSKNEFDPNRLRFLISGHFRNDRKPIYIIQDFRGGPELFKHQKADFHSKKSEGDVDAYLSGRFYKKSILEENEGNPVAITIGPYKICVDTNFSTIFDEYFEQVYKFNSFDIVLKGEFLKSNITNGVTPFLTLNIKSNETPEQADTAQKVVSSVILCHQSTSNI